MRQTRTNIIIFCTIFQFFCLLRYVKGSFSFCLSDPTFGQAYNVVSNDLEFIHEQISKKLKWEKNISLKYYIQTLHTKKNLNFSRRFFTYWNLTNYKFLVLQEKISPSIPMPKYMFKTFDLCIEVSSHILINWSILALARGGGLDGRHHSIRFLEILLFTTRYFWMVTLGSNFKIAAIHEQNL